MTPAEYADFVRARFKLMPTRTESLLHAAVGLAGEWLELLAARTLDERLEESGDCEFYIQAGYNILGEPERRTRIIIPDALQWNEAAALPIDLVKKAWVYGKPLDEPLLARAFLGVQDNLQQYYDHFLQVPRDRVIELNVAKLLKRYPNGYTNEAAIARADKAQ